MGYSLKSLGVYVDFVTRKKQHSCSKSCVRMKVSKGPPTITEKERHCLKFLTLKIFKDLSSETKTVPRVLP